MSSPSVVRVDSPPAVTGRYKWLLVGLLWLVSFVNYADRNALSAVLPLVKASYAMSDLELGLLSTSFLWVYALAASPAGWLGDRFSRKWVILCGLLAWSAATFLTPFAAGLGSFIVLRAATGLGEASYYPSGTALIGDFHGPDTRARALAIHQTAVFAGGGFGAVGAAALAGRYDWHAPYYLYGLTGMVLAAVLVLLMVDPPRNPRSSDHARNTTSLRALGRIPSVWILCVVFFLATSVTAGMTAWAPTFFNTVLKLPLTQASVYGAVTVNVAGFCAVLCSGLLSDWAVKRTAFARFIVLATGLALAAVCLLPFGLFKDANLLGLLLLAAGFFKGIFDGSIYAAMQDVVPPEARATAVGLMTTIGFAGAGSMPLILGWSAPVVGLGTALAASAFLYVLAAAMLLVARPRILADIGATHELAVAEPAS